MVSRENKVILFFVALTVPTLFVTLELTDPPTWVGGAITLGVGVIAPLLVNGVLDWREAAEAS
jgi:hypothetical protein